MRGWKLFLASLALAAAAVAARADIASVLSWDVQTTNYTERTVDLRRGETAILEPRFLAGTNAVNLTEASLVVMRYVDQTPGSAFYSLTGSVSDAAGGKVRVRWTSAAESAAATYNYEIVVSSALATLVRSFGVLKLHGSVSGLPGSTNVPTIFQALSEVFPPSVHGSQLIRM